MKINWLPLGLIKKRKTVAVLSAPPKSRVSFFPWSRTIAPLAVLAAFASAVWAETPQKHIRVIVDTSASLHQTDPSGYVKLSTELFYDLALKELDANDTFSVARFPDPKDPSWPKTPIPPERLDTKYVMKPGRNAAEVSDFHLKVRGLKYESEWTYFSPCIQWALDDLQASGKPQDNRVIVLITDGKPDPHAEVEDSKRLTALVKPLHDNNIRVFVLAFGPEVNEDWFNNAFQFGKPTGVTGQAFAGSDAGHLLSDMLQIFSRSFGFSKQTLPPGSSTVDIARDLTLPRAVVVSLYQQAGRPEFRLIPPPGKSLGSARAATETAEHDASAKATWRPISYAYEWLEPPLSGNYSIQTNGATPSEVAILRPIRVQSEIRKYQGNDTDIVMAGKPAPMEVLVSPSNGTTGDPGEDIRVRYYLKYLKPDDEGRDSEKVYRSEEEAGKPTAEGGRVFRISPEFIKNPTGWPAGTKYDAYIDVEVTQYDTPVYRAGSLMHHVQVYPYLSVSVSPNPAIARTSSGDEMIRRAQNGCVAVQFVDNTRSLSADRYFLETRLVELEKPGGVWKGAKFRFDNHEFTDVDAARQTIDPRQLGETNHTLCVAVGSPSSADPNGAVKVHFGLWRDGADENEQKLNVIDELTFKVNIAGPNPWQHLYPWMILLLTMLLLYLLLLLLRSRHVLAPDLGFSLAPAGGQLAPAMTIAKPFAASWLGFNADKPVISLSGDREIGRVSPAAGDMFLFRPNQGFQNVRVRVNAELVPVEPGADGSYRLSAGTIYEAGIGNDTYLFRIEYSKQRPQI